MNLVGGDIYTVSHTAPSAIQGYGTDTSFLCLLIFLRRYLLMCHWARFIMHFYCLAVEAGFYSDVVECLPVDPATWV